MAGARGLRQSRALLGALQCGEATRADLARALDYDPVNPPRALDDLLQAMRVAGLVEAVGRGKWRLVTGKAVCPTCSGRGIVEA
jgi:hypothetical protein